jgi:uncharacterized integral membrane protein (TIGR00698 family)
MVLAHPISTRPVTASALAAMAPGLGLCIAVSGAAAGLQQLEAAWFGRAWLEALVLAILLGAAIRTAWTPAARWKAGIDFAAKTVLEIAVVLLGATISARMIVDVGPALLAGIAVLVATAIAVSYGLGRVLRLPRRMAILIACGNSICGNSAIAAVAPVIGADGDDVAAAIAFTAVLGVVVVLALPVLALALHMSPRAFGVFAGLTVYAVPQVLAATAPISSLSSQVGALVKLVRVLMLGPVVAVLSLLTRKQRDEADEAAPAVTAGDRPRQGRVALHQLLPWFIVGFLALVAARSVGLVPLAAVHPTADAATALTIVSMAALGLGVDVRMLVKAGLRVSLVVTLSLLALGAMALLLIHGLRLA